MATGWAGPLRKVPDAAADTVLTVRVHPDDDPADRHATRYMKTDGPNFPWHPVTARAGVFPRLHVLSNEQVEGWPVQSFADVLATLDGRPS